MSWFKTKGKNRKKNGELNYKKLKRGDSGFDDEVSDDNEDIDPHNNANLSPKKRRRRTYSNPSLGKAHDKKLYVGDKILLANKRSGKVTSLGSKPDKHGIWVRVVMDVHMSSENVFGDDSARNKTIWVPKQRVERIISKGTKFNLTIGDRVVYVKKRTHGVIKYVGPTHFDKGVWFGVELDACKGKNNGTVKKKFYFEAKTGYGVMLPFKRIVAETPQETKKTNKKNKNKSSKHSAAESGGSHHGSARSDSDSFFTSLQSPKSPSPKKQRPRKRFIVKEKDPFAGFLTLTNAVPKLEPQSNLIPSDGNPDGRSNSTTPKPSNPNQNGIDDDDDDNSLIMDNTRGHHNGGGGGGGGRYVSPNQVILERYLAQVQKLSGYEQRLYACELPSITDVSKEEREDIFIQKLDLCQAKCKFLLPTAEMETVIVKKEKLLLELSEFIARHVWFKESLYKSCLETIGKNLFRPLPYQDRPPALSFFNDEVFDKDSNFEDQSWRHLKLVYDLTWRVINTPLVTATMMEKHMTGQFLKCLVELFASEDHRERAYLMMILHKIYGRCLKLRPYIIQIMSGYFYRMIYTSEFAHVNGIIELLQIICAIIPGLTVPVKDSWQSFVRNILVPLHKCRGLKKFWEQLTQCCVNYVAKDGEGGAVILGGLLKYWPQQSPQKEEIFIMEVVNIINVLITHQHGFVYESYKDILVAAASKLTECMLSTRQPVAERAIAAWKEQSMQRLCDYDRKAFLPKLCEAFYCNREHHNQALKQNSTSVEKIYRSKDSAYWKKMQQYLAKKGKKEDAIARAINEARSAGRNPYQIVQQKHAKEKARGKKPKPLTTCEKKAKREHVWLHVRSIATYNEANFDFQSVRANANANANHNLNNEDAKEEEEEEQEEDEDEEADEEAEEEAAAAAAAAVEPAHDEAEESVGRELTEEVSDAMTTLVVEEAAHLEIESHKSNSSTLIDEGDNDESVENAEEPEEEENENEEPENDQVIELEDEYSNVSASASHNHNHNHNNNNHNHNHNTHKSSRKQFSKVYAFDRNAVVIIANAYGRHFRANPSDLDELNAKGGTGKHSRWEVEPNADSTQVQLKNVKTGRYLRVLGNGDINVMGGGGRHTFFNVEQYGTKANEVKLESNAHPGQYVAVTKNGRAKIGSGGHRCEVQLYCN